MHAYLPRSIRSELNKKLQNSPVTAILGPRQCGKSTLAKRYLADLTNSESVTHSTDTSKTPNTLNISKSIYLDLQNPSDFNKLNEPELFFDAYRDHLICLDEIQLKPEFFSYLRSEVDKDRRNARFLILGSASPELIRQSSESLAGRISYLELNPFNLREAHQYYDQKQACLQKHWLRGGFPDSVLASDDEISFDWRQNFVRTFLERDIPSLGFKVSPSNMRRFWLTLSHWQGQTLNYNKLAETADLTVNTIKHYLDILEQTYMIRLLRPFEINTKKRLVKSPKLYIRDSGIFHYLAGILNYADLLGHPQVGASWESYALENILTSFKYYQAGFIQSSNSAEIDLVVKSLNKTYLYEFKVSKSPTLKRGYWELADEFNDAYQQSLVAPVDDDYPFKNKVWVRNLWSDSLK
jgi:predicted AAA+ superfamily ATPase